ncbi:MAG: gamma-glutamyltransferase, partial [Acetobacteraceae bacterium]
MSDAYRVISGTARQQGCGRVWGLPTHPAMLTPKQQARAMIRFLLLLPLLLAPLLAAAQPAQRHMVAAGHPLAVEAGLGVLRDGGSALDAAVAVQAVLTLVEPQSSGIGGGAFIMFRRAADGRMEARDGREVAPAAASTSLLRRDGRPMPFLEAMASGRAVGVPGALPVLDA